VEGLFFLLRMMVAAAITSIYLEPWLFEGSKRGVLKFSLLITSFATLFSAHHFSSVVRKYGYF